MTKKLDNKEGSTLPFKLVVIQLVLGMILGILISTPIALVFTIIVLLYNFTRKGKTTFDKWCLKTYEDLKDGKFTKIFQ